MKKGHILILLCLSCLCLLIWFNCNPLNSQRDRDANLNSLDENDFVKATGGTSWIVAKDGSGDFTKIQDAIDNIPAGNSSWFTIIVKSGTYSEHIFIDKSYIAIVGESRENSRIDYPLNRATWNSEMGVTNTGSGVVDIGVLASAPTTKVAVNDIVIANMTIVNSADTSSGTVYTHAIRGESTATRISVLHCNVLADGSDTLALWNTTTGMYYHINCSFKGGIDAVCPRGWCYDIGSTYTETKNSAPIWHEGATGTAQKFVIRDAYVQPVPGTPKNFKLLNGQKESIVYILDSYLYNASGYEIEEGSVYADYFYNVHMEGGDQSWHADNISNPSEITAYWTFNGQWDPENTLPSVLPYASIPQPWNKAYGVSSSTQLKWVKARDASSYNVYFGTSSSPSYAGNTTANSYTPGSLTSGATYYWRIDAVNSTGTVTGSVWSFKVN